MIQSNHNKKIMKMIAAKSREAIDNEKNEGMYKENEDYAPPNNTITHLTGYEKNYKKQVPIIASGRPTMELFEVVRKPRKASSGLPLVFQDQLSNFKGGCDCEMDSDSDIEGGAGEREELEDTSRNFEERALGAGINVKELQNSKANADVSLQRNLGGSKLKARSQKVKEIMAEKGLSMIEASKYIKANNIKY